MGRCCTHVLVWTFFLAAMAACPTGQALGEPVVLTPDLQHSLNLSPYVEINPAGHTFETLDQAMSVRGEAAFAPNDSSTIQLGLRTEPFWLRFQLTNRTATPQWVLDLNNPGLQRVQLYVTDGEGDATYQVGGSDTPLGNEPYGCLAPTFTVGVPSGQTSTFYLKVYQEGPQRLSVQVWRRAAFERHVQVANGVDALIIGAILAMGLLNFFIFLALRERSYLLLALLILVFGLYQLSYSGMASRYLWPGLIWWNHHALDVLGMLTISAAMLYTNAALNGAEVAPRAARLVNVLALVGLAGALTGLSSTVFRFYVSHWVGLLAPFGALPLAITALRRRYYPARAFLFAWSVCIFGSSISILQGLSFMPSNSFTEYAMPVSFLAAVMLWSFALTDRVRYREEHLERIVNARTAELRAALSQVKSLSGMLPICCHCKKVRDDRGYWNQIEEYIRDHTEADLSHGLCPECAEELYPELFEEDSAGEQVP